MTSTDSEVRRRLLRALAALPVGMALGCSTREQDNDKSARPGAPREALRMLVTRLGPWPAGGESAANEFADRLLESPTAGHLLRAAGGVLYELAARLPSRPRPLREVDLGAFTVEERELLLQFVQQLYSFLEIRNLVAHESLFGECQADPLFYTRPPS